MGLGGFLLKRTAIKSAEKAIIAIADASERKETARLTAEKRDSTVVTDSQDSYIDIPVSRLTSREAAQRASRGEYVYKMIDRDKPEEQVTSEIEHYNFAKSQSVDQGTISAKTIPVSTKPSIPTYTDEELEALRINRESILEMRKDEMRQSRFEREEREDDLKAARYGREHHKHVSNVASAWIVFGVLAISFILAVSYGRAALLYFELMQM